jgi:hypothetical protein
MKRTIATIALSVTLMAGAASAQSITACQVGQQPAYDANSTILYCLAPTLTQNDLNQAELTAAIANATANNSRSAVILQKEMQVTSTEDIIVLRAEGDGSYKVDFQLPTGWEVITVRKNSIDAADPTLYVVNLALKDNYGNSIDRLLTLVLPATATAGDRVVYKIAW